MPLGNLGAAYNTYPERLINAQPADGELPAASSISGNTLTLIPENGFIGSFGVTVTASDGNGSDLKSFSVSVINTPPVLQAISNQSASPGEDIVVNLVASDADGDTIGFQHRSSRFLSFGLSTAAAGAASISTAGAMIEIAAVLMKFTCALEVRNQLQPAAGT